MRETAVPYFAGLASKAGARPVEGRLWKWAPSKPLDAVEPRRRLPCLSRESEEKVSDPSHIIECLLLLLFPFCFEKRAERFSRFFSICETRCFDATGTRVAARDGHVCRDCAFFLRARVRTERERERGANVRVARC